MMALAKYAHFPCSRAIETQSPFFSFRRCSLFPLHCQDNGSTPCWRLTAQINRERRAPRSFGWGKSIGSNEDGNQQEWGRVEGNNKAEVERAVGNQVSHQQHVKPTGILFPRGNECSGAQWGLPAEVCIKCPYWPCTQALKGRRTSSEVWYWFGCFHYFLLL